MPVVRATESVPFEAHGSRFQSYLSPSRGSTELCAWRLEVPPGLLGVPHRPTREEALLVLEGQLHGGLDREEFVLGPGDLLHVPAGGHLRVDGGPDGASVWVTTTPGLEAVTDDGSRLAPPWAR